MILMYKLLVVDDESRQVKALANIINQLRPDYEIFTAYDGQEALDILECNQIDILFTDIRMPNVDGLQLIEKISNMAKSIKTVILSGYGEFEYAQKALRYGVNEYLVKPISKDDLHNILKSVEEKLKEAQEEENKKTDLKKKLNDSLPVYLDHQLNKLVSGKLSSPELDEIKEIFMHKGYGTVIITAFSNQKSGIEPMSADLMQHVKFTLKQSLKTWGHAISFFSDSERNMMVTIFVTQLPINQKTGDNLKLLGQYVKDMKDQTERLTTLGIGNECEDIFECIEESYNNAKAAIEYRFYEGLEKVIFYSDIPQQLSSRSLITGRLDEDIADAVKKADKTAISRLSGSLFGNLNKSCSLSPLRFKEEIYNLLLNQAKVISNLMLDEQFDSLLSDIKNKTIHCQEYTELWHYTNKVLYDIIDILNNNSGDKNRIIINKCRKYIDENYFADISLESISQKFFFNPSYFSSLFKNYTGLGFAEYLLKTKIKNAQILLKDTDDSMSDISRKVGFNDPAYFNRMFKRETGMSPLKYRQMHSK